MERVGADLTLRSNCQSYGMGEDQLVRAAHDVSRSVDAGALLALTWASGSGKFTLL